MTFGFRQPAVDLAAATWARPRPRPPPVARCWGDSSAQTCLAFRAEPEGAGSTKELHTIDLFGPALDRGRSGVQIAT